MSCVTDSIHILLHFQPTNKTMCFLFLFSPCLYFFVQFGVSDIHELTSIVSLDPTRALEARLPKERIELYYNGIETPRICHVVVIVVDSCLTYIYLFLCSSCNQVRSMFAMRACRSSIMIGKHLRQSEMQVCRYYVYVLLLYYSEALLYTFIRSITPSK